MQPQKLSPKFFFISLGMFGTLIATVSSFLSLVFAALNKTFPDVLTATYTYGYNSYELDTIRGALATCIIVFPIFLLLATMWVRMAEATENHKDATLRRWTEYIVLFLTGALVVVDLVVLVRYFVAGEMTTRFALKVLSVLLVGIVVGWYYGMHSKSLLRPWHNKLAFIKSVVIVALGIVYGFAVMGSPKEQRSLRLDQRRLDDLRSIQSQILSYWQQHENLPQSLSVLADPFNGFSLPKDPEFESGLSYDYTKTSTLSFSLCATFARPLPQGWQEFSGGGVAYPARDSAISSYPYGGGIQNESWEHGEGYACFKRTIDPKMYPPIKQ